MCVWDIAGFSFISDLWMVRGSWKKEWFKRSFQIIVTERALWWGTVKMAAMDNLQTNVEEYAECQQILINAWRTSASTGPSRYKLLRNPGWQRKRVREKQTAQNFAFKSGDTMALKTARPILNHATRSQGDQRTTRGVPQRKRKVQIAKLPNNVKAYLTIIINFQKCFFFSCQYCISFI